LQNKDGGRKRIEIGSGSRLFIFSVCAGEAMGEGSGTKWNNNEKTGQKSDIACISRTTIRKSKIRQICDSWKSWLHNAF